MNKDIPPSQIVNYFILERLDQDMFRIICIKLINSDIDFEVMGGRIFFNIYNGFKSEEEILIKLKKFCKDNHLKIIEMETIDQSSK